MLSDAVIAELFLVHAEMKPAALASATEAELVLNAATEEWLFLEWTQDLKLEFLLRLWRPTSKAS